MKRLSTEQMKQMILYVADRVIESKPYLTQVDSKIGDGDHGIGMEIGFIAVKKALNGREFPDINGLFGEAGMAMLSTMGGASGVIFSSIFLGAVKNPDPSPVADTALFSRMMRSGLELIVKRGGAQPGDKTMVDAFEPACAAMSGYVSTGGDDFCSMLESARKAAENGMEATKGYVARFGRAKSLMARAVGFQDAGATTVAIMFGAMSDWVQAADRTQAWAAPGCSAEAVP